jgi:hypothetical protein
LAFKTPNHCHSFIHFSFVLIAISRDYEFHETAALGMKSGRGYPTGLGIDPSIIMAHQPHFFTFSISIGG